MLENFSADDIRAACGGASFHRGLDYYREGMVREVKVLSIKGGLEVHSSVSGSFRDAYRVSIGIKPATSGDLQIEGDCSCPVGYNCKHVAATLIDLMEKGSSAEPEAEPTDDVLQWLKSFQAPLESEDTSAEESKDQQTSFRLAYVLEPESTPDQPFALTVVTNRAKRLKDGGYGKPASYALEKLNTAEFFIQESDRDIARILVSPKQYYYTGYENRYALKGELGQLALKKMLETGQCYWQTMETLPLELSEDREIQFEWVEASGGKRLLHCFAEGESSIVRVGRFWYVDHRTAEIGRVVSAALSDQQIHAALNAPVVPEERLEEVSRLLKVELPGAVIPTPVELELQEFDVECEPVACLTLSSHSATNLYGKQHIEHRARLSFLYQGKEVEAGSSQQQSQVLEGDSLYRILRNPELEQIALNALLDTGLERRELKESESSGLVFTFAPQADTSQAVWMWHEFLEHDLPELEASGWEVRRENTFELQFDEIEDWDARVEEEGNQWFSLALGVQINGVNVNLLPLLVDILSQVGNATDLQRRLDAEPYFLLPATASRWLKVPSDRLRPVFEILIELYDQQSLSDDGKLLMSPYQGVQLGELLNDPGMRWHGSKELQELYRRLSNFEGIEAVEPPQDFNAELRGYQQDGLNWLQFLREFNFNGILADDMGLGKTVQTLALLLMEKQAGRMDKPCLIVAPTSLMGNWRKEAHVFAPDLDVLLLHGPDRHADFRRIPEHDLVLTTYPLLRRDHDVLLKQDFHYIVLDEAQAVKNPKSQTAQTVFMLKGRHRLCLSGTPMENHLGELWSIFHFLMPGFLGTLKQFNQHYRHPIERQADSMRQEQLRKRLKPFMLRRTKSEVVEELPEKNEIVRTVMLENQQRDLYESIRLAMDTKVREEISRKGLARSHIMILDALLKLRQVCCDPRLVSLPHARDVTQSAKLELLLDMVPEMIEEGRKILIFSQFTKMLAIIEDAFKEMGIEYSKLTGQTRKRDEAIDKFQNGEVPVFLISLKAGGVGLNLTAADTVIHYDPWWNPAAENQATDRAHRIGQDKTVFVYKLVTENTVEERIIEMQARKQLLADGIYTDTSSQLGGFSAEELSALLSE